MAILYDLWDTDSGNRINIYQTEAEALAVVRDLLSANAEDYAEALSLGFRDGEGRTGLVAEGSELAKLAGRPAGRSRDLSA